MPSSKPASWRPSRKLRPTSNERSNQFLRNLLRGPIPPSAKRSSPTSRTNVRLLVGHPSCSEFGDSLRSCDVPTPLTRRDATFVRARRFAPGQNVRRLSRGGREPGIVRLTPSLARLPWESFHSAARSSALGQAASFLLAFWTDGAAAFARANGRAFTVTAAGFAAIVISSPVAGLRPGRDLVAGRTRTSSCTTAPIFTFSAAEICSSTTSSSAARIRLASAREVPARLATSSTS